MYWWQWAVYALLLFLVVSLFDSGFHMLLRGGVTDTKLDGKDSHKALVVYLPGLVADGDWSARQLTDTWRDFGDVWLVNPTGDRFEYAQLADKVADMLEADTHQQVVFIGSSLGADNALDILGKLSRRKLANTQFGLIAVCSPSKGVRDIKQPLKLAAGLAAVFRFGPLTNATWGRLYTRAITGKQPRSFAMTYYTDQVNYVRTRPAPDPSVLKQLRIVYVQADYDEIVSARAVSAWTPEYVVSVSSKHVAYDADPVKWNAAFRTALSHLIQR